MALDAVGPNKSTVSTIKAPPIRKIIASQFATAVLIAVVGYAVQGWVVAYSLLTGGLICAIPNAYFSVKAFRYRGARAAKKIVRAFYVGEGIKILLTCAGFALAFVFVEPLSTPALFSGFIIVYSTGLTALILTHTDKHGI